MSNASSDPSSKRPSLRSIAAVAGVTHATVSMALRNHPSITPRTREHVRLIANKLGYCPDPELAKLWYHVRSMQKQRFNSIIAAVTNITADDELPYALALRHGAQAAAESLGYKLEIFRVEATEKRNTRLQRALRNRGIDGVLLLPMAEALASTDLLNWDCFSVIAATYGVLTPDFHRVVPDQFGNILQVCKRLAKIGHRRIGFVSDKRTDLVVDHRFSAAATWLNTLGGIERVSPLVHDGDFRVALRAWFNRERPDAIIAGTESDARNIAKELGLSLPGPVEFAVTEHGGPTQLGGIDQRPAAIGAAAIGQLNASIRTGEKGVPEVPHVTMIKGNWVEAKLPLVRDRAPLLTPCSESVCSIAD